MFFLYSLFCLKNFKNEVFLKIIGNLSKIDFLESLYLYGLEGCDGSCVGAGSGENYQKLILWGEVKNHTFYKGGGMKWEN